MKSVPWHKSVTYNSVPLSKKDVSRSPDKKRRGQEERKGKKKEILTQSR